MVHMCKQTLEFTPSFGSRGHKTNAYNLVCKLCMQVVSALAAAVLAEPTACLAELKLVHEEMATELERPAETRAVNNTLLLVLTRWWVVCPALTWRMPVCKRMCLVVCTRAGL